MPTAVVLCKNIYDENGNKLFRGEAFEASREFIDMVLEGDEAEGREPRLTEVKKTRARKAAADADE